jgi:hypothetical protein
VANGEASLAFLDSGIKVENARFTDKRWPLFSILSFGSWDLGQIAVQSSLEYLLIGLDILGCKAGSLPI